MVKLLRSGSQLEIIPIYMSVQGRKEEPRFLFFNESYSRSILELKSKKFILKEYDIKKIIDNIRNIKRKWGSKSENVILTKEFIIEKDYIKKVIDNVRNFIKKLRVKS
jgi:hypothetical protein